MYQENNENNLESRFLQPILPNYKHSIVNLMTSLRLSMGISESDEAVKQAPPLSLIDHKGLSKSRHIILLLLDGLGYHYLQTAGEGSFLHQHLVAPIQSVFPTTTAAAISSISSGVAPISHGVTGWFQWLEPFQEIAAILPFEPRLNGVNYRAQQKPIEPILDFPDVFSGLDREAHTLHPDYIVDSDFSRYVGRSAVRHGYRDRTDLFAVSLEIVKSLTARDQASFCYLYMPDFDTSCHVHGVDHTETHRLFQHIDRLVEQFVKQLKGHEATLLITADHGLINTTPEKTLSLNDYPDIASCLQRLLCGEPRVAYCYVKPGQEAVFEQAVQAQLGDYCDLYSSQALIDKGWFGIGAEHPALKSRVGDYTIVMKDRYILVDRGENERAFSMVGVHGGLSAAETQVPFIKVDP